MARGRKLLGSGTKGFLATKSRPKTVKFIGFYSHWSEVDFMAGNETAEAQTLVPIPSLVITGNLKYPRRRFWAFSFIDTYGRKQDGKRNEIRKWVTFETSTHQTTLKEFSKLRKSLWYNYAQFNRRSKGNTKPPSALGFPLYRYDRKQDREVKLNTEVTYIRNSTTIYLLFQKDFERWHNYSSYKEYFWSSEMNQYQFTYLEL